MRDYLGPSESPRFPAQPRFRQTTCAGWRPCFSGYHDGAGWIPHDHLATAIAQEDRRTHFRTDKYACTPARKVLTQLPQAHASPERINMPNPTIIRNPDEATHVAPFVTGLAGRTTFSLASARPRIHALSRSASKRDVPTMIAGLSICRAGSVWTSLTRWVQKPAQ